MPLDTMMATAKNKLSTDFQSAINCVPERSLLGAFGKQHHDYDHDVFNSAGSTLATPPHFGPENGVHLTQRHRIRRVKPEQILDTLKQQPLRVAPATTQATSEHLQLLIQQLLLVREHRRASDQHLEKWFKRVQALTDEPCSDHAILASLRRCCTARSKSLTSLCRLQSHPAQYVSGIPSAAILLSISHPIRCSTRCLANVRARISSPDDRLVTIDRVLHHASLGVA